MYVRYPPSRRCAGGQGPAPGARGCPRASTACPGARINAALHAHGLARAPRQHILKPLGREVTYLQARPRRKPPLKIPVRTLQERRLRWFIPPEPCAPEGYSTRTACSPVCRSAASEHGGRQASRSTFRCRRPPPELSSRARQRRDVTGFLAARPGNARSRYNVPCRRKKAPAEARGEVFRAS
jgi:hypothetical protein